MVGGLPPSLFRASPDVSTERSHGFSWTYAVIVMRYPPQEGRRKGETQLLAYKMIGKASRAIKRAMTTV
jgi:hypothetical protein